MRKFLTACCVISLVSAPASAAKFRMLLTPTAEQSQRMDAGVAAVDSTGKSTSVRLIQFEGNLKKRASIQLIVMNQSETPFNFGTENVSASIADGSAVAIVSYDQLLKEEKKRQMWAAVAAGLAAAGNNMNAYNSGYNRGTVSYSGNTWGNVGRSSFSANSSGTATYSTYNSGQAALAQSLANQQNQANFQRMASLNADRMEALKQNVRTSTVDPGQVFGGSVMFELPKSARGSKVNLPMTFVIKVGGESHSFNVTLQRL